MTPLQYIDYKDPVLLARLYRNRHQLKEHERERLAQAISLARLMRLVPLGFDWTKALAP